MQPLGLILVGAPGFCDLYSIHQPVASHPRACAQGVGGFINGFFCRREHVPAAEAADAAGATAADIRQAEQAGTRKQLAPKRKSRDCLKVRSDTIIGVPVARMSAVEKSW